MTEYRLDIAEQFYYDHAPYSWRKAQGEPEEHGKILNAILLAEARTLYMADDSTFFEWVPSSEPYDGTDSYDGPVWNVTLFRVGKDGNYSSTPLESFTQVACDGPDSDFGRVTEAQIALQWYLTERSDD
jgi:hypothetical protein